MFAASLLLLVGVAASSEFVLVVTCSAHYTDFFENWLAWVQRLELFARSDLIVIAEDHEAYAYLRKRFPADDEKPFRRVVQNTATPLGGALDFESRGFAQLMSRRGRHLAAQLKELPPTAKLIFSDLDVIWIRDPTPYFVGDCDVWAQTQHREKKLLNPGFLALRNSIGTSRLLQDWDDRLSRKPQRNLPVFNDAVTALADSVSVCALPPELFLSAKRSFRRPRWSPLRDAKAIVAHANWIDGHDVRYLSYLSLILHTQAKRIAFEALGAWLVPRNLTPALSPHNLAS